MTIFVPVAVHRQSPSLATFPSLMTADVYRPCTASDKWQCEKQALLTWVGGDGGSRHEWHFQPFPEQGLVGGLTRIPGLFQSQ